MGDVDRFRRMIRLAVVFVTDGGLSPADAVDRAAREVGARNFFRPHAIDLVTKAVATAE